MPYQPLFPELTTPGFIAGWAPRRLAVNLIPRNGKTSRRRAPRSSGFHRRAAFARRFQRRKITLTRCVVGRSVTRLALRSCRQPSPMAKRCALPSANRTKYDHGDRYRVSQSRGAQTLADAFTSGGLFASPGWISREETTLFFSAKETFYKCQYPLTHRWVGFQDVEIQRRDDSTLSARPTRGSARIWHQSAIHLLRLDASHVVTLMVLEA